MQWKCDSCGLHATSLDMDITAVDSISKTKLHDKRDNQPFFIVRMSLGGNIPAYVFYGLNLSKFFRIAKRIWKLSEFDSEANIHIF